MVQAFVLVQTEVGRSALVAAAAAAIDGVVSAEAVVGPYDVIVRVEAEHEQALSEVVGRVRTVDAITRTLTCQVAGTPADTGR